jgi:hypothetical protein
MAIFVRAIAAAALALGLSVGIGGVQTAETPDIKAEGEKIAIPGAEGCFIYVTAWENGSWVDHSDPAGPQLQQGKPNHAEAATNDVEEMKRWLELLLAESADMQAKTKAACEKMEKKFIQVALVRDDRNTLSPGMALVGTPIILIDVGATEKLAKTAGTSGARNASLETSARLTLQSYLPVTIIVHELDHMKLSQEDLRRLGHEKVEGLAMADENKVAAQLQNFKPHANEDGTTLLKLERTSYFPLIYTHRPFRDISIKVRLDVAGAGLAVEQRQGPRSPRFAELSVGDAHAVDGIPSPTVEEGDADLDGIGNPHDNCPHAWNPRQRDGNGDGTGDSCDPAVTEEHRSTDALVASTVDAVTQAASRAGSAPRLALSGPDATGPMRFVSLADVWPIDDPFGIFRSPGLGERVLDPWLRAAVSTRLAHRLFAGHFGRMPATPNGARTPDVYGSAPTAPRVQRFAARIGTFSSGSELGDGLIVPPSLYPPIYVGRATRPAFARSGYRAFQRSEAGAPRPAGDPPRPSVKLFFVSTGQTTGTAFTMTAINDGHVPVWLMLNTFALRPLANVTAADLERQMKPFAGRGRVTMDVDGYCLDFPKDPPPPGMVFGLADDRVQVGMDPIDKIARAVVRLRERGRLEPDTEDASEYAHDMVQWSIWTFREGFDQRGFTRAFVAHVRKNFAAAGDPWTREMEQAVTALAPRRWTRIQTILQDAGVRAGAPPR